MIQLSLYDNATGTGGTAVISGSQPGSTNTLYVLGPNSQTASVAGSRTGDGNIEFNAMPGMVDAYVVNSVIPETTGIKRTVISGGYPSRHFLCLCYLQGILIDLDLPAIGRSVYIRRLPETVQGLVLPCIILTPSDVEIFKLIDTCSYIVQHPTPIVICDRDDPDDAIPLQRSLFWREKITHRLLSDKRIEQIPDHHRMMLDPGQSILLEKIPAYQYIQSVIPVHHEFRPFRN